MNTIYDETKEVDYLVIKEPNRLIEEFDLEPVLSMKQVLSLRYDIENKHPLFSESIFPLTTTSEGPIDDIFISNNGFLFLCLIFGKSKFIFPSFL